MLVSRYLLLLFLWLGMVMPSYAQEVVVLLHGIGRTSTSMNKLAKCLEAEDFKVVNIDYPSRELPISQLADNINDAIVEAFDPKVDTLNFVTHSMGGLVARTWIARYHPKRLGRVVMLAPPNQGSEVADFYHNNIVFKWFYGPAGQELGVAESPALNERLGPVNFPLGIIAGDRTIDPLSSMILPGKDDGKVTVSRTYIAGMSDHIILHATHTFIMQNNQVIDQSIYFLKHGHFNREA